MASIQNASADTLVTSQLFYLLTVLPFLRNWFIGSLILPHSSRPDRLRDIADRFNVDHDAVLDNVLYARAYTSKNPVHFTLRLWKGDNTNLPSDDTTFSPVFIKFSAN